jgi:hypothetical protein
MSSSQQQRTAVFTWASVTKGKPQTSESYEAEQAALKEKACLAKAERTRLAFEADAPRQARVEAMRSANVKQSHAQALAWQVQQVEHERKFSKENGWLMGQWPTSHEVPYEPRLTVPKHVNERARDWVERALASWWPEWEKCETVEALRSAFINAFVPFALEHSSYYKGVFAFKSWESGMGLEKKECSNKERYANLLKWVKAMEDDKTNPPYWNPLWVACKNITFENCLWAMNVEAGTFRALDKLCPNSEVPITGFLQVEGQVVTWLCDFTKYIPYLHEPKPKSKQAMEARRARDEERFDRMVMADCGW